MTGGTRTPREGELLSRVRIHLIKFSRGIEGKHCQWCSVNLTMFLGKLVILLTRITSKTRLMGNLGKSFTVRGVILT